MVMPCLHFQLSPKFGPHFLFPYLVEKLSDISTPFSANPWRLSSWCIAIPRQCDVSWRTYPCAPGSGDSPALRDSGSLLLLRGGRLFRSPQYLPHRPDNIGTVNARISAVFSTLRQFCDNHYEHSKFFLYELNLRYQ